jgi:hypothetical protein
VRTALADAKFVSSGYAIEEARRNLDNEDQRTCLKALLLEHVDELFSEVKDAGDDALPEGVSLPEKDRPILLTAIGAGATHLLTGDKTHFGPYFGQTVGGVLILPPAEYLRIRSAPKAGKNP